MGTIHHELCIDAPLTRVYDAIATPDGISTWWDEQTARRTDRGLVLEHNPGAEHAILKLRVVDLIPECCDHQIQADFLIAYPEPDVVRLVHGGARTKQSGVEGFRSSRIFDRELTAVMPLFMLTPMY